MKRTALLITLTLSIAISGYLYLDQLTTVKRWQAKSQDHTLIWVTKNPHFIAVKLWFELTYNICAVSIFGYSAIQLLRKNL